jgi:outer membrane protein assembly factor BamD (BamD/ComL family)
MRKALLIVLLVAFAWPVFDCAAASKVYEETSGRKGRYFFRRPRKNTPDQQLAYADKLLEEGKMRRAMRHYLALTRFWPESPQAGEAQYKYARLLDHRGKLMDAFEEYQRLFDHHTGFFPYDEVLHRQFELAEILMNRRKGKFLFFPGFTAPERAAPLFESIVKNGPQWERAPEAQFFVGQAYEKSLEYEQAVAAYMRTQQRYPASPFAEKASFRTAHCFYTLAQESPNNKQLLENAWATTTLFLTTYPRSDLAPKAREYAESLRRQRARLAYNTATYYDRIEKRPKSALIAYETLLRDFPDSDWTEKAKGRIEALKKIVETTSNEK